MKCDLEGKKDKIIRPNGAMVLGMSIGMYDTGFIERQNYLAADGTSGRDYWVDVGYFPGIVATRTNEEDDLDYYIDLKDMDCSVAKIQSASWSQYQFINNC